MVENHAHDYAWHGAPPDPRQAPALYDGVMLRRVLAYLVDLVILGFLCTGAALLIGLAGILTFGLLWPGLSLLVPAVVLLYDSATIGGPQAATPGMRLLGLRLHSWDGGRPGYLQAAAHSLAFYVSIALTSWLILLVAPFNRRRRCLHDMLCGLVMTSRAAARSLPAAAR